MDKTNISDLEKLQYLQLKIHEATLECINTYSLAEQKDSLFYTFLSLVFMRFRDSIDTSVANPARLKANQSVIDNIEKEVLKKIPNKLPKNYNLEDIDKMTTKIVQAVCKDYLGATIVFHSKNNCSTYCEESDDPYVQALYKSLLTTEEYLRSNEKLHTPTLFSKMYHHFQKIDISNTFIDDNPNPLAPRKVKPLDLKNIDTIEKYYDTKIALLTLLTNHSIPCTESTDGKKHKYCVSELDIPYLQLVKQTMDLKPQSKDEAITDLLKYAPSVPVNVSTQSNLVSLEACKFWYNQGCKRMIMAREMDKNQLKYIMENKPEGMEIEIFIHGAICLSYSGRCFLSDFLCGRSANYGSCAQSCRWSYNVYLEEKNNPGNLMPVEMDEHGTSILSSKDLCLIHELPEIIDMGVDSLKIEGRLKTEYYIASIVSIYRAAIDDYMKNPENYDAEKYMKEIEKIKTRGLTTFYFNSRENKDIQEYEGKQYNANYEFGGKVIENKDEKTIIEIRNKLSVGDELEILVPRELEPVKFTIDKLWDIETDEEIDTVNPGKQGQQVKMVLPIKAEENWIIRRKK